MKVSYCLKKCCLSCVINLRAILYCSQQPVGRSTRQPSTQPTKQPSNRPSRRPSDFQAHNRRPFLMACLPDSPQNRQRQYQVRNHRFNRLYLRQRTKAYSPSFRVEPAFPISKQPAGVISFSPTIDESNLNTVYNTTKSTFWKTNKSTFCKAHSTTDWCTNEQAHTKAIRSALWCSNSTAI